LADHLLWLIAEDARRACIPRRDASVESLADDGVVGRHHDSRKPRGFDFRLLQVRCVDQQIDGANHAAGFVFQRRRVRTERDAGTVGPFKNSFDVPDRPPFFDSGRHRAFVMSHRRAVGPIKAPGSAPEVGSELWAMAPKVGGSLIVEGDAPLSVGDVDGDRKRFQYLWPMGHTTLTVDQG